MASGNRTDMPGREGVARCEACASSTEANTRNHEGQDQQGACQPRPDTLTVVEGRSILIGDIKDRSAGFG